MVCKPPGEAASIVRAARDPDISGRLAEHAQTASRLAAAD